LFLILRRSSKDQNPFIIPFVPKKQSIPWQVEPTELKYQGKRKIEYLKACDVHTLMKDRIVDLTVTELKYWYPKPSVLNTENFSPLAPKMQETSKDMRFLTQNATEQELRWLRDRNFIN
jgi:hypothetical protein